MDNLDHKDMTIRPGPGKELKITKETVDLILGVPCAGGGKPLGVDATAAVDRLRSSLGLTKDEFTVAKLWNISNTEVLLTEEMDRFPKIDWSHLIFNGVCDGAQSWHQRTTTNTSTTIYGCCIVVFIYYLDHLHVAAAPQNKFDTPRIKYFDRNIIKALIRANKRKSWQGGEPFGHCDVSIILCIIRPSTTFLFGLHSEARQIHAMHLPVKTMAFVLPRAGQRPAMKPPLAIMAPLDLHLKAMPHSLSQASQRTAMQMLTSGGIVITSINIGLTSSSHNFQSRTDTCHASPSEFRDRVNISIHFSRIKDMLSKPCTNSGTQLTPETQLDTPVMGTQAEKIYKRQQHMRRSFETCPDNSDTEAPDDALAAANELMTNLNIAAQGISEHTSTNPPANPGLPKFDVTPQTKASLSPGSQSANCSSPSNEFKPKSMQYYKNHIKWRQRSDRKSLDNVFMQYFIECVRSDDSANLTFSNTSRLILDTNVEAIINIEEREQHSKNP
ncbi:hypothetical protein U9M48_003552 [Paspalum notatum var. saurae]|uniref:Uncharacterized protein n=1 Tax=Paspalum notatum var. saurae TaxID=547442 RepID=A0AAQ3PRC6_PASNO